MVKLSEGGDYLKSQDAKTGERVTFKDEGKWEENTRYKYPDGNPRVDFICKVMYNNEEKRLRVNKTNRDALVAAWGAETQEWVGKTAHLEVVRALVSGKMMNTILLHPENDSGKPVNESTAGEECGFWRRRV